MVSFEGGAVLAGGGRVAGVVQVARVRERVVDGGILFPLGSLRLLPARPARSPTRSLARPTTRDGLFDVGRGVDGGALLLGREQQKRA